jgi:hypothetical protein
MVVWPRLAKLKAPNPFYSFMINLFDKKALCEGNKENITLLLAKHCFVQHKD